MGWIEMIKDIIGGLRASGKNEKEIEDIVQQASDKATIKAGKKEVEGKSERDAVDALYYALEVMRIASKGQRQQESNNWRKMHGLPMRRKGKRRR